MLPDRGSLGAVIVAERNVADRDFSTATAFDLAALSDEQLAELDPLAINLVVARGLPALSDLDIRPYQQIVDDWTSDFVQRCLPHWEVVFRQTPHEWKNDIRYFRLGMVSQYIELELGIRYKPEQRDVQAILYTDPADLFLNGLIDSREGTCANLAALQLAVGWRLGWPVSLACVNSHFMLRFDDGNAVYNIEATQSGYGGFKSDPDSYLVGERGLPTIALECGSDLRALRPREVLGSFVGLRARHLRDLGQHRGNEAEILESEADWLLARILYPASRFLYKGQMVVSTLRGGALFDPNEAGHPNTYAGCLREVRQLRSRLSDSGSDTSQSIEPRKHSVDELFSILGAAQ